MAVVSTLPGVPDTRQGYDSGQHYSEAEQAEYWRRREAGKVPHPNEIKAQSAKREIEREAERKAQHPDPRAELRAAHTRRAEVKGELDRLVELRGRANDLVRDLEQRHSELLDLVRQGNRQAAAELVGALNDNQSWQTTGLSPPNEQLQAQLAEIAGRLGVARDAQAELSEQHRSAVAAVREAEALVARCAVQLAVDHAVVEAEAIEQINIELQARRASLNSLTSAITSELRRLPYQAGLYLPAAVGRVLAGLDAKVDPLWSAKLKALHQDPEAELG